MWWQQYKKELLAHRTEPLILFGFYTVWLLWLLSKTGVWHPGVIIGAFVAPATGILPLWALWTSLQLYRQEWRENTSYLLLSLPVRAWKITSAKLAALVTGVVGFSLLLAAGMWLLVVRTGLWAELAARNAFAVVPLEWAVKMGLLAYGGTLVGLVTVALATQFAYVFSRIFSRFQGLVMVWTWILTFWLMARVGELGARLLAFLPDIQLRALHVRAGVPEFEIVGIASGPFVALILFVAGLFALLNAVLERAVEV